MASPLRRGGTDGSSRSGATKSAAVDSIEDWFQVKDLSENEALQTHIQAAAKGGQWQRVLSLLEVVSSRQHVPTAKTYNASIAAVAKADDDEGFLWEKALLLLREMQCKRLRADRTAYTTTLSACSKQGEWEQAATLVAEMTALQLRPDAACYEDALSACEAKGHWATSIQLLRAAVQEGIKSESHFVSTMQACASAAQWQRALDCLRQMPAQQLKQTAACYGAVMSACDAAGKWAQALSLLASMENARITPDSQGYGAAASACAASGQRTREVELHAKMTESHMGAVMDACVTGGRWTRAFKVLQRVHETGQVPDAPTLEATIRTCGRAGQWQYALGLLNSIRVAGAPTTVSAYSAAAEACAGVGRWETVLKLQTAMECEELQPSDSMAQLCKQAEAELTAGRTAGLVAAAAKAIIDEEEEEDDTEVFSKRPSSVGDARQRSRPRLSTFADDPDWEALTSQGAVSVLPLGGGGAVGYLPTGLNSRSTTAPPSGRHTARSALPADHSSAPCTPRRTARVISDTTNMEGSPQAGLDQSHGGHAVATGHDGDLSPLRRYINHAVQEGATASHPSWLGKRTHQHGALYVHRLERMPHEAPLAMNNQTGAVTRTLAHKNTMTFSNMQSISSPRGGHLERSSTNASLLAGRRPTFNHGHSYQNIGGALGGGAAYAQPTTLALESLARLFEAPAAPPAFSASVLGQDEGQEESKDSIEEDLKSPSRSPSSLSSASIHSKASDREDSSRVRISRIMSHRPSKEPAQPRKASASLEDWCEGELRELPIRGKLKAAATTPFSNLDWKRFIRTLSTHRGEVKFWEFVRCVRECAKVGKQAVSDAELRFLFNHLDIESAGSVPASDLVAYLEWK